MDTSASRRDFLRHAGTAAGTLGEARGFDVIDIGGNMMSMTAVLSRRTKDEEIFRTLHDSQLARRTSPICSISFSALHVLDASSPLYGETEESLREMGLEIIVLLGGVDETSGQSARAKTSYAVGKLCFGQRF